MHCLPPGYIQVKGECLCWHVAREKRISEGILELAAARQVNVLAVGIGGCAAQLHATARPARILQICMHGPCQSRMHACTLMHT